MKEKLEQILVNLKAIGVSVSKIENDLGFSNGLLGKVKNGKSNLSDEKFGLVETYYNKLINKSEVRSEIKPKSEVLPTGIIELKKEPELVVKEELINAFNAPVELAKPEKIVLPKAKDIMLGADYLADVPKTTFQKLLIQFNLLIEDEPPAKDIKSVLYDLIEKSAHPDLTPRQSEAIRERCINYLNGQYGTKSKK